MVVNAIEPRFRRVRPLFVAYTNGGTAALAGGGRSPVPVNEAVVRALETLKE